MVITKKSKRKHEDSWQDAILSEWDCDYVKKTKHRKRCPRCRKLIQDGERVHVTKSRTVNYYPVKGLMAFVGYSFIHTSCME